MLKAAVACVALMAVAAGATPARAVEVRSSGKLRVPESAPLFAVSTDATMQHVLDQDFRAERRLGSTDSANPVTVTVNLSQHLLRPGVSLGQLGPGDPMVVAKLLEEAGEQPPPIGDTGSGRIDPYAANIVRQELQPDADPMMQAYRDYQAQNQVFSTPAGPRFGPHGNAGPAQLYDTIIVAQASASNSADQITLVAVVHPGEDIRVAKELLAESIVNDILH
jgi:hypothetical protein